MVTYDFVNGREIHIYGLSQECVDAFWVSNNREPEM